MVNWPLPKTLKGLRVFFLGFVGYYQIFVCDYGNICRPLTTILKKGLFQWTGESKHIFERLKDAVMSTLVLALPDFNKNFIAECDASRWESVG